MNYLAHAYLSFGDPGILAGNMISDFVKGKKQFDYPESIQKGIRLHRMIDEFTDRHPATRTAKEYFKPAVGPYAGAFVDVAYDHFLSKDPNEFTAGSLQAFAEETYTKLDTQKDWFPERFARMFPYMSSQNWLYNYRHTDGIEQSFGGVVRRASYLTDSLPAFKAFMEQYSFLQEQYNLFFPDIKNFASSQFKVLQRQ